MNDWQHIIMAEVTDKINNGTCRDYEKISNELLQSLEKDDYRKQKYFIIS